VYPEEDVVIKDTGSQIESVSDEELNAELKDPVFGERKEIE